MKSIGDLSSRWLRRKPESLTDAEARVLQSAIDRLAIAENQIESFENKGDLGDHVADLLTRIGGSWAFILSFLAFLAVWTIANVWLLRAEAFDPYPFVFLNLVLSMLAAIQAPIIMMSQNRQTERDRYVAEHDYEVNLKAEIEIMALHEKIDQMRLKEIQFLRDEVGVLKQLIESLVSAKAAP